MQPDDVPAGRTIPAPPSSPDPRASRSPISAALLAGVACVPIVVAAGFLSDRVDGAAVPGDISVLALRGVLDGAEVRPASPARAGY